jgi:hypothetical protein
MYVRNLATRVSSKMGGRADDNHGCRRGPALGGRLGVRANLGGLSVDGCCTDERALIPSMVDESPRTARRTSLTAEARLHALPRECGSPGRRRELETSHGIE